VKNDEDRPFSQKERELIDMLEAALKRAAARWKLNTSAITAKADDDGE